jgi:VWFA-related protein
MGFPLRRFLKFSLIAVLAIACMADNLTYMRVDRSVIEKRLQPLPATDADRVDSVKAQFRAAGCASQMIQEQAVPNEELPNLICMVPGPDPGAIVIGTRLESKAKGDDADVDWGSAVMLPLLAESMLSAPHHQTFIFVAFSGNDHNFAGASFFLTSMNDDQRNQIEAMIMIDKVGRTTADYAFPGPDKTKLATASERTRGMIPGQGQNTLSKVLPLAATSLKLPDAPKENSEVAPTAAQVFEQAGIPAIVLHSPSYTVITPPGKFEQVRLSRTAVDAKAYNDTYNLLCVYMLYLDKVYYLARGKAAAAQANTAELNAPQGNTAPAETFSNAPAAADPSVESSSRSSAPATTVADSRPAAKPSGEDAQNNPVFRATTRLVQVDVVVTDKQGRPIPGLKAEDFTVLQDAKPQKLRVFEPHTPVGAGQNGADVNAAAPKLPPDTYSNQPNAPTAEAWTIILFDILNTPTSDQEYARKQLMQMLSTLPKGRPVSLYLLTNRLIMIQGFTNDPEKLMQAAESLRPARSHVLTTEVQRQQQLGAATSANNELMSAAPSGTTTDNAVLMDLNSFKQQQLRDLESFQLGDRVNFTLAAFEGLSRAVSGYPGRKNLIWLSAGFPVQIMADPTQVSQPWRNAKNFQSAVAEAGIVLSKSRIAVYPTDVRGLQGRGVDISVSASESTEWTGARNAPNYGNLIGQQTAAYADDRKTMKDIADQTGGQAFMGTNDLKLAMQRSLDDGSTYYTLAYTPDKIDPETAFHRIEVKVSHPDVKLAYRRGYYSTGQKAPKAEIGAAALRGALQPGMPPATMVLFVAQVLPPDDKHKDVRVQYIVNPNSVTFEDVPDKKKHLTLDCIIVAYDKEGHEVAHASDTLDGAIPATAYEAVLTHGVPAKQEISLTPGVYNLRLGVMDRVSQQIGTLDVPMVIPDTSSARK